MPGAWFNLIDYIIYPNQRIDQDLLFNSIHWYNVKRNLPILIRIIDVNIREIGLIQAFELVLYFEVRTANFKCKAYGYKDGKVDKTKTEIVNATGETVKVKYLINGGNLLNLKVERYDPTFSLINYALQKHGVVMPGNAQGLQKISATTLETALKNLDFKAVTEENENGQLILEARPKDHTKVKYTV